ncbi:hypothetical protein Scep_001456 [Stephania cephalantha]|uniref:Uncharacterized protein n=1 Tax=Stephania cephalantha TaxID=152367 RepID=A0AAP0L935_9MAGN
MLSDYKSTKLISPPPFLSLTSPTYTTEIERPRGIRRNGEEEEEKKKPRRREKRVETSGSR